DQHGADSEEPSALGGRSFGDKLLPSSNTQNSVNIFRNLASKQRADRTNSDDMSRPGLEKGSKFRIFIALALAVVLCGCSREPAVTHAAVIPNPSAPVKRRIRATGTVQASHNFSIQVPQIVAQGGRMTLTRLTPNGIRVNQGEPLAEFDRTQQLDNA